MLYFNGTSPLPSLTLNPRGSWQSGLLAGASWATVRPFLTLHGVIPHAPWPYAAIDAAVDRLVTLPEGVRRERWISPADVRSDVFTTAHSTDHAILFLHGGAFLVGGPGTHKRAAGHMSRLTGADVYVPRYSEVNKKTIAQIIDEVLDVYLELSGKYTHVSLLGDSAGGFLTFALLNEIGLRDLVRPNAVAAFSPLASLDPKEKLSSARNRRDPMFPTNALWGLYRIARRNGTPVADATVHTDGFVHVNVPILIQASADEVLVSDTRWLAKKSAIGGSAVKVDLYPNMLHDFQLLCEICPEALGALEATADFLIPTRSTP